MNLRIYLIEDNPTLSPHRSKHIKLLIIFLVFPKPKPIALEIKRGWGRGFLCSSLHNHDSKSIEEKENKNKTKNQRQTALERVRA